MSRHSIEKGAQDNGRGKFLVEVSEKHYTAVEHRLDWYLDYGPFYANSECFSLGLPQASEQGDGGFFPCWFPYL